MGVVMHNTQTLRGKQHETTCRWVTAKYHAKHPSTGVVDGSVASKDANFTCRPEVALWFVDSERRNAQHTLHTLQTMIIHCITEREAELSVLQRRTGLAESKRFLTALNGRWKMLEQLVKDYKEVAKFNRTSPNRTQRLLNTAVLRSQGLDSDEIWEIDLLMSRSDWAVYDFVHQGIEAVCRLQRVAEERSQLRLHSMRMVGWLSRQLEILLREIQIRHERLTRCMVLHRYKAAVSLLTMKSPVASDQDRDVLWDLRRRIETLLQPESIPVENTAIPEDHARGDRPPPLPVPYLPSPVRGESPSECESDCSEEDPVEHLEQEAMNGVMECMERYEREEDASPMADQLDDCHEPAVTGFSARSPAPPSPQPVCGSYYVSMCALLSSVVVSPYCFSDSPG